MRAPVKMMDLPGYVSMEVHEELRDLLATAEQERDAAQSREAGLWDDMWNRAVKLAQGCHDYGGGYRGHEYEAFQHGISTVVCVLEKKRDGDGSYQMRMVEAIGAAALDPVAELRELRAEVAHVIERFGDSGEEQTLMQVVEAVFLNGEQGWKMASDQQSASPWRPIAEGLPDNAGEAIGTDALAELAVLRERDAERYRWLRKGDLESLRVIGLPQTADVYDRELDAEMKGGKSDGKRNSK